MTTQNWLENAKAALRSAGMEAASMEAQLIASDVLQVNRASLFAHPEREFPAEAGNALLGRRLNFEPLAYILGWREFYGRRFNVRPGVLIPRQDTEVLVEVALEYARLSLSPLRILDLGTGSGCIAITLKLEMPDCEVWASDISQSALDIALENAASLHADIRLVHSDAFESIQNEQFDLIVSNPPYIGLPEYLPNDVVLHEPYQALFSGETGLEFYQLLAETGDHYLTGAGRLMVEVGYTQAQEVQSLFELRGWSFVESRLDLAQIPRVVVMERAKIQANDS